MGFTTGLGKEENREIGRLAARHYTSRTSRPFKIQFSKLQTDYSVMLYELDFFFLMNQYLYISYAGLDEGPHLGVEPGALFNSRAGPCPSSR